MLYILIGFMLPSFVSLKIGPTNINQVDLFLLALFASFIINYHKLNKVKPQTDLYKYILIYLISTFFLILIADYVPKGIQIYKFAKDYLFHLCLPLCLAAYAFSDLSVNESFVKVSGLIGIVIGIYGLVCFLLTINPYIETLNLLYYDEWKYDHFLSESRFGLGGRISGTTNHPLSWGQLWTILMTFYMLHRKILHNYLFGTLVVLGVLNVFFAGGRSSLLALIPVFVCYMLANRNLVILRIFLVGIASVFVFSFVLEGTKLGNFVQATFYFWDDKYADKSGIGGSNANMRKDQWQTTLSVVTNRNAVAGFGLGYRELATKRNRQVAGMLGYESVIFSKTFELGFGGLFFYMLFLGSLYLYCRRRINKDDRWLLIGYFSSYLLTILFTGEQNSFGWFVNLIVFSAIAAQRQRRVKELDKICERFISKNVL